MAARIDNLRVWQDEVDQTDIHPIIGHLVDKQWPPGLALRPGAIEIFATERSDGVAV